MNDGQFKRERLMTKSITKAAAKALYDNLKLPRAVLEEILKGRASGRAVSGAFIKKALQELDETQRFLREKFMSSKISDRRRK